MSCLLDKYARYCLELTSEVTTAISKVTSMFTSPEKGRSKGSHVKLIVLSIDLES